MKSTYNGNGSSMANGPDAPFWMRSWGYSVCVLEPKTTIWTVMP